MTPGTRGSDPASHSPARNSHGRAAGLLRDAAIVSLLGLVLYAATLAPSVLWADEAHLQMNAVQRTLEASAGSHPLWVWISHQFTRLPLGSVAGRVNFVSALFGAVTLGVMVLVLRELDLDRGPSFLAVAALAVANTFWTYSVRAEIYTLALAFMALEIWLGLRWFRTGGTGYLVGLAITVGLGLAAHLLVVLFIPALLWLLWQGRAQLDARGVTLSSLALAVAASPLLILLVRDARTYGMGLDETVRWALFSFEGYDFSGAFFDFSLAMFPSDLFEWVAFLGIQFVGLSGLCGLLGMVKSGRLLQGPRAIYLALLYAGGFAFAFAYRVGDRYVFYLPSYLPFVIWIGLGWQWVGERWGRQGQPVLAWRWSYALLAGLVVLIPVGAYRAAPELVARGITFRDTRRVPGPGGRYFFLWPPKAGYFDAQVYAEQALAVAPEHAFLLADPILSSPVQFLQVVEGTRPDVTVRYCCWDIEEALAEADGRPVALADLAPEVYPVEWLRETYHIRSVEPLYLLTREGREETAGRPPHHP